MIEDAPGPRGWIRERILEPKREIYPTEYGVLAVVTDHGTKLVSQEAIVLAFERSGSKQVGFAIVTTSGEEGNRARAAEIAATALTNGLTQNNSPDAYEKAKTKISQEIPNTAAHYTACIIGPGSVKIERGGMVNEVLVIAWEDWLIMMANNTANLLGPTEEKQIATMKKLITQKQAEKINLRAQDIVEVLHSFARSEIDIAQQGNSDPDSPPPENITFIIFKRHRVS